MGLGLQRGCNLGGGIGISAATRADTDFGCFRGHDIDTAALRRSRGDNILRHGHGVILGGSITRGRGGSRRSRCRFAHRVARAGDTGRRVRDRNGRRTVGVHIERHAVRSVADVTVSIRIVINNRRNIGIQIVDGSFQIIHGRGIRQHIVIIGQCGIIGRHFGGDIGRIRRVVG